LFGAGGAAALANAAGVAGGAATGAAAAGAAGATARGGLRGLLAGAAGLSSRAGPAGLLAALGAGGGIGLAKLLDGTAIDRAIGRFVDWAGAFDLQRQGFAAAFRQATANVVPKWMDPRLAAAAQPVGGVPVLSGPALPAGVDPAEVLRVERGR